MKSGVKRNGPTKRIGFLANYLCGKKRNDFGFFVSQCRISSERNPTVICLRIFPGAKKFMDKKLGGETRFFVKRRNSFV